jgi:hypothetical protein
MKLNILSDLHLGFGALDRPINDADVVVPAGDSARPREAVAWALGFDRPVSSATCAAMPAAASTRTRLSTRTFVEVYDMGRPSGTSPERPSEVGRRCGNGIPPERIQRGVAPP